MDIVISWNLIVFYVMYRFLYLSNFIRRAFFCSKCQLKHIQNPNCSRCKKKIHWGLVKHKWKIYITQLLPRLRYHCGGGHQNIERYRVSAWQETMFYGHSRTSEHKNSQDFLTACSSTIQSQSRTNSNIYRESENWILSLLSELSLWECLSIFFKCVAMNRVTRLKERQCV